MTEETTEARIRRRLDDAWREACQVADWRGMPDPAISFTVAQMTAIAALDAIRQAATARVMAEEIERLAREWRAEILRVDRSVARLEDDR